MVYGRSGGRGEGKEKDEVTAFGASERPARPIPNERLRRHKCQCIAFAVVSYRI